MTADEVGNWGLGKGDRRYGPHGKGREFETNETSEFKHIVLPQEIYPMFRQYYHYRQIGAFGPNRIRFVPLGSRAEFPDVNTENTVPSSQRKYLYNYMVSLTDATRRVVHDILKKDNDTRVENKFIHVADGWHGSANNDEYVKPERYEQVMSQSVFTICPKGEITQLLR